MRRVIFSLYIDIPKENLVSHFKSKNKFEKNYEWLFQKKFSYAKKLGIDFRFFSYDEKYENYLKDFKQKFPQVPEYNIVNFYKLFLLYELSKEYDEILYLDFDVIPVTNINFFEEWNLNKGVVIFCPTERIDKKVNELDTLKLTYTPRSPIAKFWTTKCLLMENNIKAEPQVFNTGIIGINRKYLNQLNYFENFSDILNNISNLMNDDFYPNSIRKLFSHNNEAIWAYKTIINKVEWQEIGPSWHHFMDKWDYIPKDTNLIHCINKNFEYVKEWETR